MKPRYCVHFSLVLLAFSPLAWAAHPSNELRDSVAIRTERLLDDLASDDVRNRWYAAYRLGQIGPEAKSPSVVGALTRILENRTDHEYVRDMAAWSLGRIQASTPEAISTLETALQSTLPSVRRAAAEALGAIGPPAKTAVSSLTEVLGDKDPVARVRAAEAIWKIALSAEAKTALLGALGASEREAFEAALALGRLRVHSDDVVEALTAVLKHRSGDVRRAAKRALRQIETTHATDNR